LAALDVELGTMDAFTDWKVHQPCRVLYMDGELPLDGMRWRAVALDGARGITRAPRYLSQLIQIEGALHVLHRG
jgi:hypothetical protein